MRDLGRWDYIIVGAGSAGCVLANRLSADPDIRVLLLEAGGKDDYMWIHIPVGYLYCMGNSRTDWGYRTDAEPGLNGRALNYPRGRVLGGCSSINGMIYMRGQAADYDHWRQLGNVGWNWDDVLPYFRRSEDHYAGGDDLHGGDGEWRVEQQRLHWPILDAVRDAFAETGIPKVDDFNRGDNAGVSYFQVNQRRGWRWNTARAFLRPARERANLKIQTHAQVSKLIIEDGKATGLSLTVNGAPAMAKADGEIILAAGSIGSVQILQLSGIGPAALLRDLDIPIIRDRAAVGGNLQDHLQVRTVFKVKNAKTLNETASGLAGKMKIGLEYLVNRSGPMSMAPSQLGAFAKSDPSLATPNLQWHIQPLSLDAFGEPLHPFPAITASVCNLRPESRGHVQITSADPGDHPAIRPNYLSTDGDRQIAAQSIRVTREVMAAQSLRPFQPNEHLPGATIDDDAGLAKAAGDIATTIFHPVGTCRMGSDDEAVVDPRLRVNGIAGLRVVDASVMPTITSGNTNSPTIMIAEKAADMIRADRRTG